jgi:hypothetical protein
MATGRLTQEQKAGNGILFGGRFGWNGGLGLPGD